MWLQPVVHKRPCVSSSHKVLSCSSGHFIIGEVEREGSWANGGRTSGQKPLSPRGSSAKDPGPSQTISPECHPGCHHQDGEEETGWEEVWGRQRVSSVSGRVGLVFLTSTSLLPDAPRWAEGTVCNPRGLPGRAEGVLSQDSGLCCGSLWVGARQLPSHVTGQQTTEGRPVTSASPGCHAGPHYTPQLRPLFETCRSHIPQEVLQPATSHGT